MTTNVLTIPYPAQLLTDLGETPEAFEKELRFLVAAKLYELGRVSSGQAARLAQMERVNFLLELGRYQISIFNYGADELDREISEALERAGA